MCFSFSTCSACFSCTAVVYLINKPLRAAGMSAENLRGWEIIRNMNIWPWSEPSKGIMKFWGHLSCGNYQPTNQQSGKGFIYDITLPLIFISRKKPLVKSQCWSDGDASYFFDAQFKIWLERKRVGLREKKKQIILIFTANGKLENMQGAFFAYWKGNFNYERQNVQSLDDSVFKWSWNFCLLQTVGLFYS